MFLAGLFGLWLVVLAVLGVVYGGDRGHAVARRLGESLRAESTLEESNLALVRGWLALGQLRARREDEVGSLALDVGELHCELPPVGLALLDSECRALVLARLKLEVSSLAMFRVERPKRPPIRAGAFALEDAHLVLPLKVGSLDIHLDHALAGETTFKTPLSWVFALERLRATVKLPLGTVDVAYVDGMLVVWGEGLLFPKPVVLPLVLPVRDPDDDPKAELARITQWGRTLVDALLEASRR